MNPPRAEETNQPEPGPRNTARPPENPDPSIAPDVPQSDLVLRKLKDLIRDDKFTPEVEQNLGMTREEAEQFVKKFEKRPELPPIGPGREIVATPGEDPVFAADRKAPEFTTKATVSNRSDRSGTTLTTDSLSDLREGNRSTPPPGLSRQWKAYQENLRRGKPANPPADRPAGSR